MVMERVKATMSVAGDEKRVGYRCSDEIGVGVRMRGCCGRDERAWEWWAKASDEKGVG
jgi:hypothetical protein